MKEVTRKKNPKIRMSRSCFVNQNYLLPQKDLFPVLASCLCEKDIEEKKKKIKEAIKKHLFNFGGDSPTLTYDYSNEFVADVCIYAKDYLKKVYYPKVKNLYKYWMNVAYKKDLHDGDNCPLFSKMIDVAWFTNIPRLIPYNQDVLNVLPFLLTCYLINMPHNKLDPQDAPLGSASPGWLEIFSETSSERQEYVRIFGGSNRSKNIQSLSSYFVIESRSREGIAFYDENLFFCKGSKNATSTARRIFLEFWENYHRFVLFCMACKKAQEQSVPRVTHTPHISINYTLSMILFSSIWKFHTAEEFSHDMIESDPLKSMIFDLVDSENIQSKYSVGADSTFFKIADCLPKDYLNSNILFEELFDSLYSDSKMTDDSSNEINLDSYF